MSFFLYHQRDSYGAWFLDFAHGIGHNVIIEAPDAATANSIAEDRGLYFHGVAAGVDCSCCGDRWTEATDEVGTSRPEIDGEEVVFSHRGEICTGAFVHYLDGTILYGVLPERKDLTDGN